MKSASAILTLLSREDLYDPLASHPWRQSDAVSTPKWSCIWPVRRGCLGIRPHGIGGALAKTRAHPTGQTSSNRHHGALPRDAVLKERFDRIAATRGKKRAIVALARRLTGRIRACFRQGTT